jgi:energy-coupling factor transporter ATP-binding protein EcfA2
MKLVSISIHEFRGLRDLTLDFRGKSFVVYGPNGSGKSGVVDAIEFALTGDISRLSGHGTSGVTLAQHGPHVERRNDPGAAVVTLGVESPAGDRFSLSRSIRRPKNPVLDPDQPQNRKAAEALAQHPELVLSRREIIKYVLAQPTERSTAVQALLRLDRVSQIRSALVTANNQLQATMSHALQEVVNCRNAFTRQLGIATANATDVLAVVNLQRVLLGLEPVSALTTISALDAGIQGADQSPSFNKKGALRDLDALIGTLQITLEQRQSEVSRLLAELAAIEQEPGLLPLMKRQTFIAQGLEFVDSPGCPLCDLEWPSVEALKAHLADKLAASKRASEAQARLMQRANEVGRLARSLQSLVPAVVTLAASEGATALVSVLSEFTADLPIFATTLETVPGVIREKQRLTTNWVAAPANLLAGLTELRARVEAKPDQSATTNAHTFLVNSQMRYADYRRARQRQREAERVANLATVTSERYARVTTEVLNGVYDAVEGDFSSFYRQVNADDEASFKAEFDQQGGKLGLSVDFYGRGMFPPVAYHSEGHQDSMGVCLYLALMRRLFGDDFSFAVLDDVVMSIDRGHRREFCGLLQKEFPNTQFIITTHDPIWARQIQAAGVVSKQAMVQFHGWSVTTGPAVEPEEGIWDRIAGDLGKDDVNGAGFRLRRYLEGVCAEIADEIAAPIPYRADDRYELGDLFNAVVGRHADLLGKASAAANSWNDEAAMTRIDALKRTRGECLKAFIGEQWVVNTAVHFNEWASLSPGDFQRVVTAGRGLLDTFRCCAPGCESWLHLTSRVEPEALRCRCGGVTFNLRKKS